MKAYILPDTIAKLVQVYVDESKDKCKNLSLILSKYPPSYILGNNQEKSEWLRRIEPNSRVDTALTKSAYIRWSAMMSALQATRFNAELDWRMVIGMGGETVLETDLTLHHLYGIPFIPGSALKGLTRAYVTGEYKKYYVPEDKPEEQRRASKKTDDDHSEIKGIFGTQKEASSVLFFDAMPKNGVVKFVVDIMNPHYPDYYNSLKSSKTTPPANDQQPNPITFLTVTDTIFTFALAPRNPNDDKHKADVELVKDWLLEALQKYGVGGKTSAGYGYFKKEMPSTEPPRPEKAKESVVQIQAPSRPAERLRAKLPQFRKGQEIKGSVVLRTEELRRRIPSDVKAVLSYESFPTTEVIMALSAEEVQNWKPGETRFCILEREEQHDGIIVWVCKPRLKKDRKK